ncbi:CbiG protein/precorrin-3B C17-methyltransferase, partial [Pseudomonas syringae pv. actinidiae ICMP 18807]
MANALLHQAASELDVPVRFDKAGSASEMASSA